MPPGFSILQKNYLPFFSHAPFDPMFEPLPDLYSHDIFAAAAGGLHLRSEVADMSRSDPDTCEMHTPIL